MVAIRGFPVYDDEGNFYYSGDTALTLDMQLIPGWAKLILPYCPLAIILPWMRQMRQKPQTLSVAKQL